MYVCMITIVAQFLNGDHRRNQLSGSSALATRETISAQIFENVIVHLQKFSRSRRRSLGSPRNIGKASDGEAMRQRNNDPPYESKFVQKLFRRQSAFARDCAERYHTFG